MEQGFNLNFQDFNGKRKDRIMGMTRAGAADCLRVLAERIINGENIDICVKFSDNENGYTTITNTEDGYFDSLP